MRALKRVDAALARAEGWLLIASLLGILGLGLLQIVLRHVARGLDWADEVMRNLTLWVGFLGASLATWEGKHINVDALTRFLGPRARAVIAMVIDLAAAAICIFLAYSAAGVLALSVERLGAGDPAVVLPSGVPKAVWQALFPAAFGIIAVRFLVRAAESAWELKTGGEVREIESEGPPPATGGAP
jgi:TRAP-type C4-dicarboxylate transport system permease small subunit